MREGEMQRSETAALIDVAVVARLLGVGERYVRRLVFERQIEFVKVGHYVRFDPNIVHDWIEQRRRPPASGTTNSSAQSQVIEEGRSAPHIARPALGDRHRVRDATTARVESYRSGRQMSLRGPTRMTRTTSAPSSTR